MDPEEEKKIQTAKKRNYVIQEILDTEKAYVDRLQAVHEVYIEPMTKQNIIDGDDIRSQFGFWEVMTGIHKEMLQVMLREKEEGTLKMGLLFFKYSHYFKVYKDYLVNFELALTRRGVLMTSNRKFMQFVEEAMKDPRCFGLGIESLLIGPVQRIPRYRMLFSELLKCTPQEHEEHEAIVNALDKVSELASENNEAIRNRENKENIMAVMMNIDSRTRINLLDDPSRTLLRSGILQRQCRRVVKEFMFWLFSDKLLYGEMIPGIGSYWLHREIQLVACRIADASQTVADRSACAITVESPAKSFVIWTKTPEDKLSWLNDITKSMDILRQKIKSETGRIAPIWMPDAKSTNCVLCENPFGIFNRKHHCRNCGLVVCGNCSKNRFKIEHVDAKNPVRVCNDCYDELNVAGIAEAGDNPHTAVSRTIRRKSAILQNNASSWNDALMDDENDGLPVQGTSQVDGDGNPYVVSAERDTIRDFETYREEIDSIRAMKSASFENPVVASMRRRTLLAEQMKAACAAAAAEDTATNRVSEQPSSPIRVMMSSRRISNRNAQLILTGVVDPFPETERSDSPPLAPPPPIPDTIEILSDYSSEDSDYETVNRAEIEAARNDPRIAKVPRKSRKSKLASPNALDEIRSEFDEKAVLQEPSDDPIPPAIAPIISQNFNAQMVDSTSRNDAPAAAEISTPSEKPSRPVSVAPPKPPKRASVNMSKVGFIDSTAASASSSRQST